MNDRKSVSDIEELNFSGFSRTCFVSGKSLIDNVDVFILPEHVASSFIPELPINLMLGKRAEKYFSKWIEKSSEYELVLENIQVFNGNITLGEFDFIVKRLSDNTLIHVELVYKFYLLNPSIEDSLERWVGPNNNDTLALKIDKMRSKQFPLLYSDEGTRTLAQRGIDCENIEQQLAFFCNLFLPYSNKDSDHNLNNNAEEGYWYTLDEFISADSDGQKYFLPKKTDWFIRNPPSNEMADLADVLDEVKISLNNHRSPMVWKFKPDGSSERLFVIWW